MTVRMREKLGSASQMNSLVTDSAGDFYNSIVRHVGYVIANSAQEDTSLMSSVASTVILS